MRGEQYQLRTPILGIFADVNEHRLTMMLPQGAVVEVHADLNDDRLVNVIWNRRLVTMFTIDLRNRCDKVETASNNN